MIHWAFSVLVFIIGFLASCGFLYWLGRTAAHVEAAIAAGAKAFRL